MLFILHQLVLGLIVFDGCDSLLDVYICHPNLKIDLKHFEGSPLTSLYYFIEEMIQISPFYESNCPVCKEEFDNQQKPFVIKRCQHVFCQTCLFKILETSERCPICNQIIEFCN